jgi:hypothetical protein
VSVGLPGNQPRPGADTPPGAEWLQLLARQLFETLDSERRRGLGFTAMRQVEVSAVDVATLTATVILGGDLENPVPMVRPLPGYVPRAGDVAWAWQNGSDLMLIGGPGLELPKVKIRKGATSAITSGDTNAYIDFGAGDPLYYDRYGMWDATNQRITFPWPGKYLFRYQAHWDEAPAGAVGGRRIAEIEDQGGNIRASDRIEWDTGEVAGKDVTTNPESEHVFAAGDWIKVKVFQSSGGPLSILNEPFSNVFSCHYLP